MKIATHNVFWFQGSPFASDRPGDAAPDILGRLIQVYRRLAPDLLCLQEIQGEGVLCDLADRLKMSGAYSPGGVLTQYGGGALWQSGRLLSDSQSSADRPQRMLQLIEVSAGADVLLVANLHLPSSRHLGPEAAAERRLEETAQALGAGVRPDVVLGDFNEQPGSPLGQLLGARGYRDAACISGRTDVVTTPRGRRNDQIWLDKPYWHQLVAYGVAPERDMRSDVPGKDYLSDHFPVWVELAT